MEFKRKVSGTSVEGNVMNVAICDDCKEDADKIKQMYERVCGNSDKIAVFDKGAELISVLKKSPIDLIFLDIDLSKRDEGIRIKDYLSMNHVDVYVIFVTSHDEYMADAFGERVLGFIDKAEILIGTADEKLNKIMTNSGWKLSKGKLLEFEDGKSCYTGRITHVIHSGNYTYVYLYDAGNIMTDMSIAKIKQRLSTEFFFLESKMFIVAYSFIRSFDGEKIILKNGNKYKIPRDKIHSFKSGFRNFKIEHMKIYY